MTILFESPNVFKVLPEWPDEKHCKEYRCWHNPDRVKQCGCGLYNEYDAACEQSKANAIRIDNPEILNYIDTPDNIPVGVARNFQVEGFEYTLGFKSIKGIDTPIAILKLAKEEEPKEQVYTIDEIVNKLKEGLSQYGKKRHVSGFWVLEDNVYYILNKLKK